MGQANIQIGDWRFYTDATPDTSMSPLAAENTKPTLTQSQIENGIIRLRCQLLNIGDKDDLADVEVQYSVDDTNWNTISNQAGASADQWIWWANGAATHGNTITNLLLGDSDTYGLYHEDTGLDEDVDQNTKVEFDCALYIQWPPPSTTVRLRILYDGVAEEYEDGVPQIQFDTPTPANRSHTIDKLDPPASGSQAEIRGAMRPNTWFDGSYWWTFVADADNTNTLLYYYWSGSGNWSSAQSRTFTDTTPARGNDVRCKAISGYKVVMVYWNHNQSGDRYVRRGTISGTTITWGSEVSSGVGWRGERVAVGVDDGNYWWCGGIQSATGVWAVRATNADAGSSWTTGFNAERTASDTGVATDDECAIIGLASNKMLMIWRSGDALKWALCTDPSGFGSVNMLVSTANPVDWGVARSGGYVYLVHTDSTGAGGNWVLRVFNESTESWSLGTSPSVSGQPSTGDGILVQANGDDIYAWGTFTGTGGGTHRSVEGKKYAGPGASGTWDGSRTVITPAIARGNGDHINGAPEIANGKALVIFEFGDANLDGQKWSMEFHYLTLAGPVELAATLTAQSTTPDTSGVAVSRAVAGTLSAATATPEAILGVLYQFTAVLAAASTLPDSSAFSVSRALAAVLTAASQTPDTSGLAVARALEAVLTSSSTSPDAQIAVSRALTAILAAASVTPDDVTLSVATILEMAAVLLAQSATSDTVALAVARSLQGVLAAASTTPTPALTISRAMSALLTAASVTPDDAILSVAGILEMAATLWAQSATSDSSALAVSRLLSGAAAAGSTTPDATLGVLYQLTAVLLAQSALPDTSALNVSRALAAALSAASATPDVTLVVARALAAALTAASVTPDDVTLSVAGIVELAATLLAQSATPDSSVLAVVRTLAAALTGASATPDASLAVARSLAGAATAVSITPDVTLGVSRALTAVLAAASTTASPGLAVARALAATLAAASQTSDADLAVSRALTAVLTAASVTPDDVTLNVAGILELAAVLLAQSSTAAPPLVVARSMSAAAGATSATSESALAVSRAIQAILSAASVTPEDVALAVTKALSATLSAHSGTSSPTLALALALSAVLHAVSVTPDDADLLQELAKLLDVLLSDAALYTATLEDSELYSVSLSDASRT